MSPDNFVRTDKKNTATFRQGFLKSSKSPIKCVLNQFSTVGIGFAKHDSVAVAVVVLGGEPMRREFVGTSS